MARVKKTGSEDISPKGCLTRFAIVMAVEFVTAWICARCLNMGEDMTMAVMFLSLILVAILAIIFDKYALPSYSQHFTESSTPTEDEPIHAVCPYCLHINYIVSDDGYCLCEKCGAYFQDLDHEYPESTDE